MPSGWRRYLPAGLVLVLIIMALLGGGGSALATTFAALLSGSSTEGTRLDGIEVLSWSHGVVTAREAGSGLATGRRQHQPLLIRKRIDKATPLLYRALGRAETFPTLRVAVSEPGSGKPGGMTITLTNAKVTEIATGDIDGDGFPDESVSLTYEKIAWSADGVTYEDTWSTAPEGSVPTYAMAINEKGLPGRPKKAAKVSAYRTQIISPRDAASGLPTGRRQHKPFLVVVPSSDDAPELTEALLSGRHIEMVTVITYGANGEPTGAISLLDVQVVSMTETRRSNPFPFVKQRTSPLFEADGSVVTNPLYEASETDTGVDCVYELTYQTIQWLDATGGVTHEDTWDAQR